MMDNKGGTKQCGCWVSEGCCCCFLLEQQRCHAAHFALLLYKDFKVLVDDGHGQEDSGTGTDSTQEVGHYRQPSYTEAAEGSGCGDVPAQTGAVWAHRKEMIWRMGLLIFYWSNGNRFSRVLVTCWARAPWTSPCAPSWPSAAPSAALLPEVKHGPLA